MQWPKLKRSMYYEFGQAGSLIMAFGGDEDMAVEEFATMNVDNCAFVSSTRFGVILPAMPPRQSTSMDAAPSELIDGRAVAAHSCARIWAGLAEYRAAKFQAMVAPAP